MRAVSRTVAFVVMGFLLTLSVVAADEKDKKADPPKDDAKKADVKKDEPAKKDDPAKKDAKKDEPAKKDEDKKAAMSKLPPRKGKLKQHETDPEAAYKKMLMKSPKVTATVMAVVEDKKALRLKITVPYVKINAGALNNYYNAQISGNIQQMVQAQNQIYQLATTDKEVEWTASDDFKARRAHPPAQFDDKGRPKRYTRKELQELKGNDKLPGFAAEFSDIKTGQIVTVTLLAKKAAPRPIRRGKDAEAEVNPDDLPKMSFIFIEAEPKN
jgi:hypothetical protein